MKIYVTLQKEAQGVCYGKHIVQHCDLHHSLMGFSSLSRYPLVSGFGLTIRMLSSASTKTVYLSRHRSHAVPCDSQQVTEAFTV